MYSKEQWKWSLYYHIIKKNGMMGCVFRENVSCLDERLGK